MNDVQKAALMSLVRSGLVALGAIVVKDGYADQATVNEVIGALLILAPAAWGSLDKYVTDARTKALVAAATTSAPIEPIAKGQP